MCRNQADGTRSVPATKRNQIMLENRIRDCQQRVSALHGELQGLLTDVPSKQAIRVNDLLDSVTNLEISLDRFSVCVTIGTGLSDLRT